jgi:hypothetical protein
MLVNTHLPSSKKFETTISESKLCVTKRISENVDLCYAKALRD